MLVLRLKVDHREEFDAQERRDEADLEKKPAPKA
jgi:hypothetical protein